MNEKINLKAFMEKEHCWLCYGCAEISCSIQECEAHHDKWFDFLREEIRELQKTVEDEK